MKRLIVLLPILMGSGWGCGRSAPSPSNAPLIAPAASTKAEKRNAPSFRVHVTSPVDGTTFHLNEPIEVRGVLTCAPEDAAQVALDWVAVTNLQQTRGIDVSLSNAACSVEQVGPDRFEFVGKLAGSKLATEPGPYRLRVQYTGVTPPTRPQNRATGPSSQNADLSPSPTLIYVTYRVVP